MRQDIAVTTKEEYNIPDHLSTHSHGRGSGWGDINTAEEEDGPPEHLNTCAINKSTHPGQIVIDNKQKRCTPAQVQADNNQKKLEALKTKQARIQEYQDKIVAVVEFENQMAWQELDRQAAQICPDLATQREEYATEPYVFKKTYLCIETQTECQS